MKMKKSAIVAVMSGAALFVGGAAATVASAQDAPSVPGLNVGNNSCIAPWMWNGPGVVGTTGNSHTYSSCTGGGTAATESGLGLLNNACILPWNWNGPLNGLISGQTSVYSSCAG